jgi:hypothetical protein
MDAAQTFVQGNLLFDKLNLVVAQVSKLADRVLAATIRHFQDFYRDRGYLASGFRDSGLDPSDLAFKTRLFALQCKDACNGDKAPVEKRLLVLELYDDQIMLSCFGLRLRLHSPNLAFDLQPPFRKLFRFLGHGLKTRFEEADLPVKLILNPAYVEVVIAFDLIENQLGCVVAFGFQPLFPSVNLEQLLIGDRKLGPEECVVEGYKDVSGFDGIAISGLNAADNPAIRMLNDLPLKLDLDPSTSNDRSGDLSSHAPRRQSTDQDDHGGISHRERQSRSPSLGWLPGAHETCPRPTTRWTSPAFFSIDLMISSRGP